MIGVRKTTEEFIDEAVRRHGDRYDYSLVDYKTGKDKVAIICGVHGKFEQSPEAHLKTGGCWECGKKQCVETAFNKTNDSLLDRFVSIHGDKYDYSMVVFNDCKTKVEIGCPIHGYFYQQPSKHLMGRGCIKCGIEALSAKNVERTNDTAYFIKRSKEAHGDKYGYEFSVYTRAKDDIIITCPTHGNITQKAVAHMDGDGCVLCRNEHNNFHKDSWSDRSSNKTGVFYIIRCFNETESFYKFGITINTVGRRYCDAKSMPYSYEIVRLIISTDRNYIWDLEKRFSKFKLKDRYDPIIPFMGGKTECFSTYTRIDRTR